MKKFGVSVKCQVTVKGVIDRRVCAFDSWGLLLSLESVRSSSGRTSDSVRMFLPSLPEICDIRYPMACAMGCWPLAPYYSTEY